MGSSSLPMKLTPPPPPPPCLRVKKMKVVRSEMKKKMYKGTHMREQKLTELIQVKVKEATEVCSHDHNSEECKVAWDEVEEISQAKADLRRRIHLLNQDPLHHFCQENPATDECRIYED